MLAPSLREIAVNQKPRALIADADDAHNKLLADYLISKDWDAHIVKDAAGLRQQLATDGCALLIIALLLDDKPIDPLFDDDTFADVEEIVLMGEQDDPSVVQDIMRKGAAYFFCKPFDDGFLGDMLTDLYAELCGPVAAVESEDLCPIDQFGALRGSAKAMKRMYRVIRKVAPTSASVLLIGESGTGKELVAETIHRMSDRAEQPLVAMNCGAIAAELIESELFGHEKGAFTGATKQHKGFFERASGSTLFLDEITEMPIELQVKLLRVLEVGRFRRVGGEQDLTSDVRIVAATNRDPRVAIEESQLREDLYYRIASFPISIPPLRKRGEDITGLAQYFLNQHNHEHDTQVVFSDEALQQLRAYEWPGNVRELISVVERAYVMANDVISGDLMPELLALSVATPQPDIGIEGEVEIEVGHSIDDAERELILATLEAVDGDKKQAADMLGISLKTLYNRLNEYENAPQSASKKTG